MAIKTIVDTHSLIWYLESNPKLGNAAKAIFDDKTSSLVLPMIALAEAVFIVEKGKTSITDVATLLNRIQNDPRIEIVPFDFDILQTSLRLTTIPEMHDRYIVATGLYLQSVGETVQILTKDNEIIVSKLLPIVWH